MSEKIALRQEASERFWAKVNRGDGCWEWTGALAGNGYGTFWLRDRMVPAHRAAWFLVNGPIEVGFQVLHRCDNPRCVRTEPGGGGHLFIGTVSDNMRDMNAKGRGVNIGRPRVEEECRRGHPFTAANTIHEGGKRKCRECRNEGLRRRRALARLDRVSSRPGRGRKP